MGNGQTEYCRAGAKHELGSRNHQSMLDTYLPTFLAVPGLRIESSNVTSSPPTWAAELRVSVKLSCITQVHGAWHVGLDPWPFRSPNFSADGGARLSCSALRPLLLDPALGPGPSGCLALARCRTARENSEVADARRLYAAGTVISPSWHSTSGLYVLLRTKYLDPQHQPECAVGEISRTKGPISRDR